MLLGPPGLTTTNKKLLEAHGRATKSKDATRGSWPYWNKKLLGPPGLTGHTTRNN